MGVLKVKEFCNTKLICSFKISPCSLLIFLNIPMGETIKKIKATHELQKCLTHKWTYDTVSIWTHTEDNMDDTTLVMNF